MKTYTVRASSGATASGLSLEDAIKLAQRVDGKITSDAKMGKDPAAVALGRKGGLKGGKARAAKMTPDERSAAAQKAALARWYPQWLG